VALVFAGIVIGVFGAAALQLHAEDPKTDVETAARAAGVDPVDLAGAANTVGVDVWVYARSEGLLESARSSARPPVVAASPPALPAVSARVACLEAKESGGANVANARGSGAVGVLQFMPSTFAAHAAEMGHPEYSPWNPAQARAVAAHDLALGRRAQWTVGGC
jgi:soluble lytic murein transglycosylase-like protein